MKRLFFRLPLAALFLVCACAGPHHGTGGRHIPPPLPERNPELSDRRAVIVRHALNALGHPYQWGGAHPDKGFDCSGLVVFTHARAGIQVPRKALDQFSHGLRVAADDLKPADLVFFKTPGRKKAFHVGIYTGNREFIHAPGRGRTVSRARLDNPYFKKHFMGARTFL